MVRKAENRTITHYQRQIRVVFDRNEVDKSDTRPITSTADNQKSAAKPRKQLSRWTYNRQNYSNANGKSGVYYMERLKKWRQVIVIATDNRKYLYGRQTWEHDIFGTNTDIASSLTIGGSLVEDLIIVFCAQFTFRNSDKMP